MNRTKFEFRTCVFQWDCSHRCYQVLVLILSLETRGLGLLSVLCPSVLVLVSILETCDLVNITGLHSSSVQFNSCCERALTQTLQLCRINKPNKRGLVARIIVSSLVLISYYALLQVESVFTSSIQKVKSMGKIFTILARCL